MRGKINAAFGPNRHWRWLQSAVTSRGQIFSWVMAEEDPRRSRS